MMGEIDKYTWVDIGLSAVPSELVCAFLLAQLERIDEISRQRERRYNYYLERLQSLSHQGKIVLPNIPSHASSNYHAFYVLLPTGLVRNQLLEYLRTKGIQSAFHFVPLHSSPMGQVHCRVSGDLAVTESVAARQLRLPFFTDITEMQQDEVVQEMENFF